ncbi:MAG TPA: SRPBCC domain-containing protein, partial [Candidatus Krumholzibacteria bacterium]|nr:SRPBCC domain-containing protein [Candidatus Krumholzibacteria bacterium]
GGGFYEYFDEKGNGVRHAVVTYVDRPKILRMEGPLGLAGSAFQGVYTYNFEPAGDDSTTLTLKVQASGHVEPAWAGVVESVWRHFLIQRFKPYIEQGAHKGKR